MLRPALVAVLFSTAAWCQNVGVFLQFDAVPSRAAVEVMKREVDALLKPSGVSLNWRLADENRGAESFANLVLLKFLGKCRADVPLEGRTAAVSGRAGTLGATKVVDGRVLPFSEVRCDAVTQALSYLRPEANGVQRQQALGLAMGRVVAHELYHVLANVTAHATLGMAKAVESLDDLVSTRPSFFSAESVEAIRKALH
jgi:hypothetical protein